MKMKGGAKVFPYLLIGPALILIFYFKIYPIFNTFGTVSLLKEDFLS